MQNESIETTYHKSCIQAAKILAKKYGISWTRILGAYYDYGIGRKSTKEDRVQFTKKQFRGMFNCMVDDCRNLITFNQVIKLSQDFASNR